MNEPEQIKNMQKHLLLIRRSVGWTAEEFGERIGVTRQTINNIESGRNKLTKTQYIAMRCVLDAEIAQYPEETEMLRTLLLTLVDYPDDEKYREEREKILAKANMIAPSILSGTSSREDVSNEFMESESTKIAMDVIAIAAGSLLPAVSVLPISVTFLPAVVATTTALAFFNKQQPSKKAKHTDKTSETNDTITDNDSKELSLPYVNPIWLQIVNKDIKKKKK